ncbi:DUF4231 domain-containing protein [Gilvimarinus sp. 2_MG-2023]|uniref:DUF4231 domain-containing protein n=1 Tax=Gilvimarinus sp. 2_MG-2023 TaxID=3062666 RepID=UPI0026E32CA2|nr:DUF4231 domain-containing protein [Gilvimarinus sp. 2_MG-2023]
MERSQSASFSYNVGGFLLEHQDYPGLYRAADSASAKAQLAYLRSFQWHIVTLITGAALAVNPVPTALYSLVNAGVFLAALGISVLIAAKRYEKSWYSARAVAESVKTSTWRYMMRADPFLDAASVGEVNNVFRRLLEGILSSNNQIGDLLGGDDCARDQITQFMRDTRAKPIEERRQLYLASRIKEQRNWYAEKSKYNKNRSTLFFVLLVMLQIIAVGLVLSRIAFPEWKIWPTEVFVVAAGSVTAWMQLKRFQEIGTAYALTAHEIGIIESKITEPDTDELFSEFVRDAENAFSREHTQWIAKVEH